eukprot:gene10026-10182_t
MSDILFAVKNNFYIGAYNNAINEASDLEGLSEQEATERDVLVYRSYIALGSHELVISEVKDSAPMALQAVKLLAKYLGSRIAKASPARTVDPEEALETVGQWVSDPICNNNPHVLLVAGLIYANEGNYVEALKACHSGQSLEMLLLTAITYTQHRWQEASYIYQELGDKYNWTAPLHNGLAVCHMKMGEWEDAERDLLEALGKDAKDPDTLANLVTVGLHLGKNTSRYASQLKVVAPNHPMTLRAAAAEDMFAHAAAAMA